MGEAGVVGPLPAMFFMRLHQSSYFGAEVRKGVEGLSFPGAVAVGQLKGDFEHCTVEEVQKKIPSPGVE
jgi:hypothetical protein